MWSSSYSQASFWRWGKSKRKQKKREQTQWKRVMEATEGQDPEELQYHFPILCRGLYQTSWRGRHTRDPGVGHGGWNAVGRVHLDFNKAFKPSVPRLASQKGVGWLAQVSGGYTADNRIMLREHGLLMHRPE